MTMLAYIALNPVARDVLLSAGLLLAAILIGVLMASQMRLLAAKARRVFLSVSSIVALAAILWSVSDPVGRLAQRRQILHTTQALLQFCLSASDADLQIFGIRPNTETWEVVPPDGYQRLLADAKRDGVLRSGDDQFVDPWGRPFRISVLQTGGKRFVSVSSFGADAVSGTVDDIASVASVEIAKR